MAKESPVFYVVNVNRLPKKGMPVVIGADEATRAALAAEHDLISVESFCADLVVSDWKRGGIRVKGEVAADITQACVVTLEPVTARIREEVDALFVPEGSRLVRPGAARDAEIMLDPEGPDAPQVFSGDEIDIGALAEEYFALGIDPYPRSASAGEPVARTDEEDEDAGESPFAKLLSLKPKS